MELRKDNNSNSLKAELNFSSDYNLKNMLPWKKKSYSVCSSQFRGTFGKDNGKIPKIIKNLSEEAQLASNNFVEEAISDPSSLRFSNLSNLHIKLKNVNSAKFLA